VFFIKFPKHVQVFNNEEQQGSKGDVFLIYHNYHDSADPANAADHFSTVSASALTKLVGGLWGPAYTEKLIEILAERTPLLQPQPHPLPQTPATPPAPTPPLVPLVLRQQQLQFQMVLLQQQLRLQLVPLQQQLQ
jgi:hypothetical protein